MKINKTLAAQVGRDEVVKVAGPRRPLRKPPRKPLPSKPTANKPAQPPRPTKPANK